YNGCDHSAVISQHIFLLHDALPFWSDAVGEGGTTVMATPRSNASGTSVSLGYGRRARVENVIDLPPGAIPQTGGRRPAGAGAPVIQTPRSVARGTRRVRPRWALRRRRRRPAPR